MGKPRHRAERAPIHWRRHAAWFVNWWRYFRHYKRGRTNHWILDPVIYLASILKGRR